jgi:3-oxoacyl-[acyl-carrier protein] reductase
MSGAGLKGKVAIVTGATSGIGRAIALRLASDGALVAVNHRDDIRVAEEVIRVVEERGGKGLAVKADVSDASAVRAMFAATLEQWRRIDIVINNAAWSITKPIVDVTEEEFDRIFATNVKGSFVACQEAARHLADGGRIINLSSAMTGLTLPGYGVYDATKGAVEQLARFLAQELGGRGITVNTVSPGATETEQFRRGKSEETVDRLANMAALKRLGRPEDIADVIAFLVSEEARWVTGQNIRVNGGTV